MHLQCGVSSQGFARQSTDVRGCAEWSVYRNVTPPEVDMVVGQAFDVVHTQIVAALRLMTCF
jgi:hypothetical protein